MVNNENKSDSQYGKRILKRGEFQYVCYFILSSETEKTC